MERFEPPVLDHHAAPWVASDRYELRPDARRFENWENNIAAQIGLGVAIDYTLEIGIDAISERIMALAAELRARLAAVDRVTLRDLGPEPGAIVTFTVDGIDPVAVREALAARRINVSVSNRGSTRLDMERRGLDAVVRASVHYYNTEEEIDALAAAVAEARA